MITRTLQSESLCVQCEKLARVKGLSRPRRADLTSLDRRFGKDLIKFGPITRSRISINHNGGIDVLFLGEAPGQDEHRLTQQMLNGEKHPNASSGEAFVGPSGVYMDKVCTRTIPDANIVFDNVFPVAIDGGSGKPTYDMLAEAEMRTTALMCALKPKLVIAMGAYAIDGVMGWKKNKVLDRCGDVYELTLPNGHKCWLILGVHPAYIIRNPHEFDYMGRVMDKAVSLLRPAQDVKVMRAESFDKMLKDSMNRDAAVDLETKGLTPHRGGILCCSIAFRKGSKILSYWSDEVNLEKLRRWLVSGKGMRIMHNAKFENMWIRPPKHYEFDDTMVRHWFINENEPLNLDHLAIRYARAWPYWLGVTDKANMAQYDIRDVGTYCGYDTGFTFKLWEWQEPRLTPRQKQFLRKVGNPMAYVLAKMETAGIKIDVPGMKKFRKRVERKARKFESEMEKSFPGVNWNSTPQVADVLYNQLKLPIMETTGTGAPSTKKEVMDQLYEKTKDKRLKIIVEFRNLSTKIGRIIDPILASVDNEDYIHTTLNYALVHTGRLSSSNPNLQNLERGGEEKKYFISRFKGGKLIMADYGQFELRTSAIQARDRAFRKIIAEGRDPHTETAEDLGTDRQTGKKINLSMASGISAKGLNFEYGIPLKEARFFHREWFRLHPDIHEFQKRLKAQVKARGYVECWSGRRRHLPYGKSHKQELQRSAERKAVNFPIQGGGADFIFSAMVKLDRMMEAAKCKSILILQVHDEIIVDAHPDEIEMMAEMVKEAMTNPTDEEIYLPLVVDLIISDSLSKG